MRQSLALFLFVLVISGSSAQSFTAQGNRWYEYEQVSPFSWVTNIYTVEGDTLVAGNTYAKVYRQRLEEPASLYALVRESDEQVLRYYSNIGESVLYDWSLVVGDTVVVAPEDAMAIGVNDYVVISSIDTITLLDGQERRRWTCDFINLSYPSVHDTVPSVRDTVFGFGQYIEDMGVINQRPIFSPLVYYLDYFLFLVPRPDLLCFERQGQLLWTNPDFDACVLNASENLARDATWSVYPNPVRDQLRIRGAPTGAMCTVVGADGRVCRPATPLTAEGSLDLAGLPPAVYWVLLKDAEGTTSRRAFVVVRG